MSQFIGRFLVPTTWAEIGNINSELSNGLVQLKNTGPQLVLLRTAAAGSSGSMGGAPDDGSFNGYPLFPGESITVSVPYYPVSGTPVVPYIVGISGTVNQATIAYITS